MAWKSTHLGRLGAALALTSLLVGVAGCAPRAAGPDAGGDESAGREVQNIAIVTPEKESDYGWNQQGLRAARTVADELGLKLDENSDVGYDNTETILTQVAEKGADLVVAHASGFNTAGARVGQATGVPTLVVDVENNVPGKVATAVPRAEEGAYLAGVAAAESTETGIVGIVASAENLNWFLMAGGFAQGVHSVDPAIEIRIAYIGPAEYGDSAGGRSVTDQVIASGADIIFGMGDGATVGYLQAVETANVGYPVRYIGTIGDVTEAVTDPNLVLTSVLWNFADTYRAAIADIKAGTFGTKTYELTVANGGLSLQESPAIAGDVATAVDQASTAIADGSVKVRQTTTKAEVEAALKPAA
jgi:basic membrane protein A